MLAGFQVTQRHFHVSIRKFWKIVKIRNSRKFRIDHSRQRIVDAQGVCHGLMTTGHQDCPDLADFSCSRLNVSGATGADHGELFGPIHSAAINRFRLNPLCSGSMIPDTNVGGNIATINEVSDDQKATFFFS